MFTGIIETVGTVKRIARGARSASLEIEAPQILDDVKVGDSIATNGVCLTATSVTARTFTADVMHETLERSSLGTLTAGSHVNLERAMAANGRFGGHFVSGHIDATGTIARIERDDTAIWYTIDADPDVLRYVVEKGSIAIDGISLTVARVTEASLFVSTIPHTNQQTTLPERACGDVVNLECDVIAKYTEKLLGLAPATGTAGQGSAITMEFLAKNGF
ncbi:MAG: riboflavin synthase [Coriobacteriales bacterium]|nr:riboflavin synthase [Coriobacteriaceae bacterium]MDY2722935.1 riboflavin synthase [Coriobacteriales bacterium]